MENSEFDAFREYDKWSNEWDNKIRYAIRGNVGSRYEGKTLGVCIAEDTSEYAYVFDDKRYAEQFLGEYKPEIKETFHIEEVDKVLLQTTYKKAHII